MLSDNSMSRRTYSSPSDPLLEIEKSDDKLPVQPQGSDTNSSNNTEETTVLDDESISQWPVLLIYNTIISAIMIPITDQSGRSKSNNIKGMLAIFFFGSLLGLIVPKNSGLPTKWYRLVSSILGYTYFLCWSISFYPQIITNYRRKSTQGLSGDFSLLNLFGFTCYSIYTSCFFWSDTVKNQYKKRHGENSEITVQSNDVAFACHSLILCFIQFSQILYYNNFHDISSIRRHFHPFTLFFLLGMIASCLSYILLTSYNMYSMMWPLDYLYLLSFVKVAVTVFKYIPQVNLNFQRKSTVGWNIWNVLLDFAGGMLSLIQLLCDCLSLHDFTGITGNWVKFGLSCVSMLFDIIFLLQHYVIYPNLGDGETMSDVNPDQLL